MIFYFVGLISCAKYAILYAGSNTWINYRHQADIFTIYNQLLARGFSTSEICLFAYDDIANDYQNPYKGQVFHATDHKVNVYPGSSAITVRGKKVTDEAFYNAISKLPTTSDDYVFIYYDNHGGPGILGTPTDKEITAEKLSESLNTAASSNLYKQCLFIIEACYSGSIAEVFTAPRLFTITAANNKESSYVAVYDEELGTYLSDEFTNYFIALIDEQPDILVGDLYMTLKQKTALSHVCSYGDESMKSVPLSTFIGKPSKIIHHNINSANLQLVTPREATEKTLTFLSQHEKAFIRSRARLQLLQNKAQTEKLNAVLEMLVQYVDPKNYDTIMNDTDSKITPTYFQILRIFIQKFGKVNPDDYGRFNVLKALAASHTKAEIVQGIFAVLI